MANPVKTVDVNGDIQWNLPDGRLHREDGPAIERLDGSEEWYQHDQRHREDGPAIVLPGRIEAWWLRGLRHRKDGPAMIHGEYKEYWIDGIQVLVVKNDVHFELIKKLLSVT